MSTESILFLLGTDMGAERPDDYMIHEDPDQVVTDLRDSDRPPPPSTWPPPPDEQVPSSRPPSSRAPSSRARGAALPSVFDQVELGASPSWTPPPPAVRGGERMPGFANNLVGMRDAISSISIDERGGPGSNRIAVQERMQNASRIRDLAAVMVSYRAVGVLNSAHQAPMHARASALYRHANAMSWEITDPFPQPPFVIELVLLNSVFQLPIRAASMRDGLMLTPLPPEVVRLRRRWGRRTSGADGTIIELRLEGDGERRHRSLVRDISFTGMSFWLQGDDVVRPGTRLVSASVKAPGGAPIRVAGEISFVAGEPDGAFDLCGVRLDMEEGDDRARWRDLVSKRLHPTTRAGRGYYGAIWDCYAEAGYLSLSGKDPERFAKLRECFFRNAERIDATPDVGCLVVWPHRDKVIATISMLKPYRGTWFVFQLAKVRGDAPDGTSSRQVLRDVHLHAYEHAQLDPELEWCLAYPQHFEKKTIWSHAVHYQLPKRYTTAGLACIVRFRALEISCAAPAPEHHSRFEIDRPSPAELAAFLQWIREARPRPYWEAYDLTPERVDLADAKALWKKARMARDREIRVARLKGQVVAWAILEDAEEGAHLFRLMDFVRPFPAVDDLSIAGPAMDALVDSAKAWFHERHKDAFCCFLEQDEWLTPWMKATMEDMGQADITILQAKLLPELLEEVAQVTAPRSKDSGSS